MATTSRPMQALVLLSVCLSALIFNCGSERKAQDDAPAEVQQKIWTPRWHNLGGDAQDDPTVCSWSSGRLDVFWRGTDNTLQHRWYDGGWSWLENLGGDVRGAPAAVSTELYYIDVFYFNQDGDLVRRYFSPSTWTWQVETLSLASGDKPALNSGAGPTVTKWANGRLDVFWRGASGALLHKWRWDYASAWTGVENMGESLASDPAGVSWANGTIDIFWRSGNNALMHKWFPACSTCGWWSGSQARTNNNEVWGAPGVASWGVGRLDVFWRRLSSTLGHTWRWDGDGAHDASWWGGVEDLGGYFPSGVDAVSWGSGRLDIFARQGAGNDVMHLQWQTQSQNDPWYNDPPGVPQPVTVEQVVTSGAPFEFSAVVAPPGTSGCANGAFAVSGRNSSAVVLRGEPLLWASTMSSATVGGTFGLEDDSSMTRAPDGTLLLARGISIDPGCGSGEEGTCTQEACPPGNSGEFRSGTAVWRSIDCGKIWTLASADVIDPISSNYGLGTFGGGPCWGGWDREEIYFDSFSNRLFLTMGAETDIPTNVRSTMMFRSQPGGAGPYSMHQYKVGDVHQPIMMTSLPGMMFFATCEDSRPTLRWMEPENANWNNAWSSGFPENSSAMRKAQLAGGCSLDTQWSHDGSQSVSRVGTYWDDSGVQWWVVRVAVPDPPNARVITGRVNANNNSWQELGQQVISAGSGPSGQVYKRVAQLTMIEQDPAQNRLPNGAWNGENTTLYYWREEFWNILQSSPANIVRARAVRDVSGWGPVFDVSAWGSGVVNPINGKPGDFARGGSWVNSSFPENLYYLVVWGDIPSTTLRSKGFILPRGAGNN